MKQEATVLETDGNIAVVETKRSSMCSGCEKNSSECGGHCEIYGLIGTKNDKARAKAVNDIGAKAGDRVEVEAQDGKVLGYAALVFIFPIIVCGLVYGIVHALTKNPGIAIGSAAVGFLLAFGIIAIVDRKIEKKQPVIHVTEIISSGGDNGESE